MGGGGRLLQGSIDVDALFEEFIVDQDEYNGHDGISEANTEKDFSDKTWSEDVVRIAILYSEETLDTWV